MDVPLRCRCGRVRGVAINVSPANGFRFVCYCKDCQAFARFLDRADVLDSAGGTNIFHMPPGRVRLTAGTDAMRCLRFSNRVLRWYAECCRTPIANTAVDLAQAMTMNPRMKILIEQGYFDLAVPYRSVEYVIDHLDVAPDLRANVSIEYYDAGHMMYVHPPSMAKFKKSLSDFVSANGQ